MARTVSKKNDAFWKFNQLVSKKESGCWEWLGFKMKNGYGHQRFGGKKWLAHRYSYAIHRGNIPDGLCVMHTCDNPSCVNPNHLSLGTQSDNIADCVNKNRVARGESRGSKITADKVLRIRSMYKSGEYFQKDLADLFGVSRTNITLIVNNKRWTHLGG